METGGMAGGARRIRSSLTREAFGPFVGAGFLASGSSPHPRPSPGLVARVAVPYGTCGGGLAGYSGGTAQALDLLPFSPRLRGAPRRLGRSLTVAGEPCQSRNTAR